MNKKKNGVFCCLCSQRLLSVGKEENTLNLGLKKKGLIQCIAGKKGLAGLVGMLGLLGHAGPAGLLACGPCWPPFFFFPLLAAFCQLFLLHQDSHVSLLSFPFFSFALLQFSFFLFLFSTILLFLLVHFMFKYLFVP